jgi:hypothetical protein
MAAAEKRAMEADTTRRERLKDPVIAGINKTPLTTPEVSKLLRRNAVGGERAFAVARDYAARVVQKGSGPDYRATLAASASALAAGFSPVAYQNGGRQLIGAGYDLGQKDDVIVADLIRSGIVSDPPVSALDVDIGGTTPPRLDKKAVAAAILRKMRRGEFKLLEDDARRLLSAQLVRVEKSAFARKLIDPEHNILDNEPGAVAWETAGDHTRAALAVLYLHSKDWKAQVEALKAGDWQRVAANLKVEDREKALAAVRLLATDPAAYRAFLTNN